MNYSLLLSYTITDFNKSQDLMRELRSIKPQYRWEFLTKSKKSKRRKIGNK